MDSTSASPASRRVSNSWLKSDNGKLFDFFLLISDLNFLLSLIDSTLHPRLLALLSALNLSVASKRCDLMTEFLSM